MSELNATLIHVYPTRVWIESDFLGDKHVVMQHDAPGCDPFTYCTLHYDHRYTSNAMQVRAAETIAISLGAKEPVEHKHREIGI